MISRFRTLRAVRLTKFTFSAVRHDEYGKAGVIPVPCKPTGESAVGTTHFGGNQRFILINT